jgi:hypothetical protein
MAKGNGKAAATRRSFEQRSLPCKLTEPELLKRGEAMAECELQIEKLKLDRTDLNNQIKVGVKQRGDLAHVIDTGEEDRDVRCEWLKDFKQNAMRLVRLDTQGEVETRTLTASERQGDIFHIVEAPVEAAAPAGADADAAPPTTDGPVSPPPRRPRKKRAPSVATRAW